MAPRTSRSSSGVALGSDVGDVHPWVPLPVAHHQHGEVCQRRHDDVQRRSGDGRKLDSPAECTTALLEEFQTVRGQRQFWVHAVSSIARLAQPRRLRIPRQARESTHVIRHVIRITGFVALAVLMP